MIVQTDNFMRSIIILALIWQKGVYLVFSIGNDAVQESNFALSIEGLQTAHLGYWFTDWFLLYGQAQFFLIHLKSLIDGSLLNFQLLFSFLGNVNNLFISLLLLP